MEKIYHPQLIEQHWYQIWENNQYFAPHGQGAPFCIMMPPPNVTGSLHMGHGFGYTLIDILIRYHRMCGDNTLWQPGTDHAGIATQLVVERQLLQQGTSRQALGRKAFEERAWEWKHESGGTITRQLRRLGASADWGRERFTLDDSLSEAVRDVFIRLYEEGLIYRGTRLVNWDPSLLTAISDLEVINHEEEGSLWHIRYPLVGEKGFISVATTRPETLLGDVAVAVHPEDERYQHFIGKHVQLPLTNRTIPIIADEYVEKEFGSGCVKITPAHDFNDYAIGQRHQLIPINIFTKDAHLNENAPPVYQGLERFAARQQIVSDLTKLNLIEKIEKYTVKIPRGEKSNSIIEPYLTPQWFINIKPLAEPAIRAVEQGDVTFVPENWNKTYFQWMNHIEDWCISRQLWWGHRIPAWYGPDNTIYVGRSEKEIRERYGLASDITLKQEEDVLDTWFSAALWPFSSLGWPKQTPDLSTFYPTQVLVTGFDILFFWVARMIMMGLKLTGKVPFKQVLITGLIRDAEGQKMSKTKGNVLDPLDLIDGISLEDLIKKRTTSLLRPEMAKKIEKITRQQFPEGIAAHGTDALRFTFCALASQGREIRFDLGRLEGYRNFCNKLWNATRYVLMNTEGKEIAISPSAKNLSLPDKWILSRLQTVIQSVHTAIAEFRFDLLAHVIYEFIWNEFCDWYLELSKPILISTESHATQLAATRYTLVTVLETSLRLLHPLMPFITEEIWQRIAPLTGLNKNEKPTMMFQPYPQYNTAVKDEKTEKELEWLKNIIIAIRTIRSEMNIPPNKPITILFHKGSEQDKQRYEAHRTLIINLAKLESVTWLNAHDTPPESATAIVGELEIFIPMAGLINKEEELTRLNKEITKLKTEAMRAEAKLATPSFVERAPQQVVEKEQQRLAELKTILAKLDKQLERIGSL